MKFDVVVIGSGPGGYVAAIRAAQLGFKTAIIERYSTLGGTCLNVGCIPSKTLLDSSEHYHNANKHFDAHGISIANLKADFTKMVARKNDVVSQTCAGVEFLMKKNKIKVFEGHGSFSKAGEITIKGKKTTTLQYDKAIIATGSKPSSIPGVVMDKKRIISSTEALNIKSIPKEMLIIGAGVIGLELGSVYQRLGTKVKVVEYMNSILPTMDKAMAKELTKSLKKMGMEFYLGHAVQSVTSKGNKVTLKALDKAKKEVTFTADYCLVACGRKPYTDNLGLDKIGVATNKMGQVEVNDHLETSSKGVYAIGDVIKGAMLAHKAEEEGVFVAEILAGQKPHINYRAIPGVVYTWPEVASVGYTEDELKKEGRAIKIGSFRYAALGRARAAMETDGLIKVIADKNTDEILGVHMVGARVADMIVEAVVALEFKATAEDIALMSHAHPTFTEAMKEACLDATGKRALHM